MRVSVVIANYNRLDFLPEAVDSILQIQDHSCIADIVIVDDASTEPGARQKISALRDRFPELIKTVFLEKNMGQSHARNVAIRAGSGEIILPLDNDDKISPDYIPRATEILRSNEDIGIVYSQAEFIGAKEGKWTLPAISLPNVLIKNVIFNSSFFRKKDWQAVGGYDERMRFWEDWNLWLSILSKGKSALRLDITGYYYRQYDSAQCVTKKITDDKRLQGYQRLIENNTALYQKYFPDIPLPALPATLLKKREQILKDMAL